jgi:hypothetical protein
MSYGDPHDSLCGNGAIKNIFAAPKHILFEVISD